MMRLIVILSIVLLGLAADAKPAKSQCTGVFGPNAVCGNPTGAAAQPKAAAIGSFSGGGGGGGGSAVSNLSRAQIPSNNLSNQSVIVVNGYATAGDRGYGATYTSTGANCSTGLEYIKDSVGTCFNLVINTTTGVNIGWFGAKGDSCSTTIAAGDISANPQWRGTYTSGTCWDTVGAQEALYAAFAINSTPGTLVWNVNSGLNNFKYYVPKGVYGINRTLFTAMSGFTIEFDSREDTMFQWNGAAGTKMWLFDSASYGLFINFSNECNNVAQSYTALTPCVSFDNDGSSPGGLKTQQITFINPFTVVAQNGIGYAVNNVASGSGQGDTLLWLNSYWGGDFASSQAAVKLVGSNTLNEIFIGGDCQGFVHSCIQNFGGQAQIWGMHYENQNNNIDFVGPTLTQVNTDGADVFATGGTGGNGSNAVYQGRTEAEILSNANGGSQTDVYTSINTASEVASWVALAETVMGQMVKGGTKVRTFMAVDNGAVTSSGACPGWCTITGGFGTTTLTDSTASYTTNALVGSNLWYRDAGVVTGTGQNVDGVLHTCTVTANTATTITSACVIRTASTGIPGNTLSYQVGGNTGSGTPSWDSAADGFKFSGALISTSVGSNCVGYQNLGNYSPTVGDWLIIPHADQVNPGGGNPVWDNAFYAKITAINSGTPCGGSAGANSFTVNRNATVATNALNSNTTVYACTPLSVDGSVTWCNVPWAAVTGGNLTGNNNFTGAISAPGAVLGYNSSSVVTNPASNWFDTSSLTPLSPNGNLPQTYNFLPGVTQGWACQPSVAATVDLTNCVRASNLVYFPNVSSNMTLNGPTSPPQLTQELVIMLRSNGTNHTVTFGSNFASNGTVQTGPNNTAVTTVTFRNDGSSNGTSWNEVSRSNPTGANSTSTVSSPAGPNSTSAFKMQGLAGAITPIKSGIINLQICGTIIETGITAAGSGISYQLSYGTGSAPTTNATLTGTQVGTVGEYMLANTVTAADVFVPFCQTAIVTGLTPGTAYWIDLAAEAVANTGFSLSNVNIVGIEF